MLSSAAKGQRIAVCDTKDYERVYEWISAGQADKDNFIQSLCAKADAMVSEYRLLSARFHSDKEYDGWIGKRHTACCYGENHWQSPAALYEDGVIEHSSDPLAITKFEQVCGSTPSHNNFCDIDRALAIIEEVGAKDAARAYMGRILEGAKADRDLGALPAVHGALVALCDRFLKPISSL